MVKLGMPKILLIEDTLEIGDLIAVALNPYPIRHALTLAEAEEALKKSAFELFLIDVALPDGNGFDFCVRLCQDPIYRSVPKILLTGSDQVLDKVYGFNCGADDYVTKPFHLVELRARVERFLRKIQPPENLLFNYSCFAFDLEFQKCFIVQNNMKTDLGLTPTEFRLFLILAKSEGRVLTRHLLEQAAWETNGTNIKTRGIDTHIAHLRKKLGDMKGVIVSIYGQGYSFSTA